MEKLNEIEKLRAEIASRVLSSLIQQGRYLDMAQHERVRELYVKLAFEFADLVIKRSKDKK